ncbi:MAG: glutamate racemase [Patescibacteria group bacterium]|jgi:glutamate racemase
MIGVFDSGIGGLSILREIRNLESGMDVVYFGDTAHVPYGDRLELEVKELVLRAIKHLMSYRPAVVVIACNTATAVAIEELRRIYSDTPIIGVVPVLKTLAEQTRNNRVAVVATQRTLSSPIYHDLKQKFAPHLSVLEIACPDLVRLVEAGQITTPAAYSAIRPVVEKIIEFNADAIALGSTHFPWLRPVVEELLPGVRVLDSGAAVARHLVRVLNQTGQTQEFSGNGEARYLVTGEAEPFSVIASKLLGKRVMAQKTCLSD